MIASERKDGYGQLVDPEMGFNQASLVDTNENEETKLLNDEDIVDESLFTGLDPNHPLNIQRKELDRVKL